MKTVYYIDENCRDKLELMPALRDILLFEGAEDVKIAVTASEFFHHTGFRAKDKALYFDADEASSSSARRAFLTRHKDMMEILPLYEGGYAAEYEEVFLRLITPYLRKDNPEPLPAEVESEIRRNAAHVIAKYTPELTTDSEPKEALAKRIALCITPGDPDSQRHDAAIIAACMRSGKLLSILKKREQERFDKELPDLLGEFIGPQRKLSLPEDVQEDILRLANHYFAHTPNRPNPLAIDQTIAIATAPGDEKQQERNRAIITACKQSQIMRKLIKTRHSDRYQALYTELLHSYLQPDSELKIPEGAAAEVRKVAAEIIKLNAPHLSKPEEKLPALAKRIELTLQPDDTHHEMNQIILQACRQSEAMRRLVKSQNIGRFDALFEELLNETLNKNAPIPPDIQNDVRKYATPLIHKIEGKPDLPSGPILKDNVIDLSIDLSDSTRRYHDNGIIEACRQSERLTDYLKKHARNYTVLTDDLADREMFSHIKKLLRPNADEAAESQAVKFVVVTDDEPFADKLKKFLFKGSGKDSVCLSSDEFLDFCEQKITSLRTKAAKETVKPASPRTVSTDASEAQAIVIETESAARVSTALVLAKALQSQHAKQHRSKPVEPKPAEPQAPLAEPEARKRKPRRSESETLSPTVNAIIRQPVRKRVVKPPPPASKPDEIVSHELDPSKLGWQERHAYLMSLTPAQRKAKNLQTTRDEYAEGLEAMKLGEIHFIKRYECVEEMENQSQHPHFIVAKKLPKPDSLEYRVVHLCTHITQGIGNEYRQSACDSLSHLLNLEGDAKLTPENLLANRGVVIAKVNKRFISKSVSFDAFLKNLCELLDKSNPLCKYKTPNADTPIASDTPCLIKDRLPAVVREVLAEEMTLSQADLDKVTITELGGHYRVDLPNTLEASAQDTRKAAGMSAKRIANKLGVKARHYQPNPKELFSQPVLFLPKTIASATGTAEYETADAIRDMIQMSLGLKDEEMEGFGISLKNNYYRVRIPALTTHYDALTGDPDYASGAPTAQLFQSQSDIAKAISEHMGISIINQESAPIFEKDFAFTKKTIVGPALSPSPPAPAPDLHAPDPDRLGLLESIAYQKSQAAAEGAQAASESEELEKLKRGAIIYAKVPTAPAAAPAPEKSRPRPKSKQSDAVDKVYPGDTVAPYLYFSDQLTRKHLASHGADKAEEKSNELLRDMLGFTLGLQADQLDKFKVERSATPGLLKVRIPSVTYRYDELTDEPVSISGEGVRSVTLSPEQVADILSSQDALGVTVANSRDTAMVDSKIKMPPPPPKVEPPPPKPDPHAPDPNRLPFHERLNAFSQLSPKRRRAIHRDSPEVQQLHFANIWFLKNGDTTVPYLFLSQSMSESLGFKTDADIEQSVKDVLRATLGLKYHQLSAFKLEKSELASYRKYKMRIPPITYVNNDGPETVFETLSALEVAKLIEESLGTRIVGNINHPNREQNVSLVSPRDWVPPSPPKTGSGDAIEAAPKPTRLQRFTSLVKRTLQEAGEAPERPYPFSKGPLQRTGSMGMIKTIKLKDPERQETYILLTKAATQDLVAFSDTKQQCRDLCEHMAALGGDEQAAAFAAIHKLLGVTVDAHSLSYAYEPIQAALSQRYHDKPNAFDAFLVDLKNEGTGEIKPFQRYHPPLHDLGERLKEMMQSALDLSDPERDAIQLDASTFTREPCMIRLPSITYSAADQGGFASKVFTPEEVAKALQNEFDIAIEGQEAAGSGAHAKKHRNSGGKHGR